MRNHHMFDLSKAAAKINTFSVNLHDAREITPTLHRVVLSYTGVEPEDRLVLASQVEKILSGHATVVPGSFSHLTRSGAIKSVVGYVRSARPVIEFTEQVKANKDGRYQAMASNLLMDKTDESLWEIRSNASGQYLAKQSHDDLSELVQLAKTSVLEIPKFTALASIAVQPREFAQFVDRSSEEVMNGFVVASTEESVKILAFETSTIIEAGYDQLIEVAELDDDEAKMPKMAKELAADQSDPQTLVEYYRQAYSFSPEYIQKIIDMISQHRFA